MTQELYYKIQDYLLKYQPTDLFLEISLSMKWQLLITGD